MEAKRNGPRGGQQEEENAEGCQVAIIWPERRRRRRRRRRRGQRRKTARDTVADKGSRSEEQKADFLDFNFLWSVVMCCCHDTIPSFVHRVVDGAICRPVAACENQQAAKTDDDDADCRLRYLLCPYLAVQSRAACKATQHLKRL